MRLLNLPLVVNAAVAPMVLGTVLASPALADPHAPAHAAPAVARQVTAEQALMALKDGNSRFVVEASQSHHQGILRRCETFTNGQFPIATVLACADSRVPVEMIFDQGIGDLFVVRVVGNVADTDEIGSIEYGVGHLNTPLVVVLGHTRCGAVTAVVEGAELPGHLGHIVDNIRPAADLVRAHHPTLQGPAAVSATVTQNVWQSIEDLLTRSTDTADLVREGRVQVVGAVYDLHSGGVQWLGRHPHEATLLAGGQAPRPVTVTPTVHAPVEVIEPVPAHVPEPPSAPLPEEAPAHDAAHEPTMDGQPHDPHSVVPATTQHAQEAGHNYLALGVCLAGSGALSGLVIRFLKKPEGDMHAHAEESAESGEATAAVDAAIKAARATANVAAAAAVEAAKATEAVEAARTAAAVETAAEEEAEAAALEAIAAATRPAEDEPTADAGQSAEADEAVADAADATAAMDAIADAIDATAAAPASADADPADTEEASPADPTNTVA